MAKLIGKRKTVKKKTKKRKVVVKTVKPVSTPVGSVHFDEFLRACKEPANVAAKPVKKTKKKKKTKTRRNANARIPTKPVRTEKRASKKKKSKKMKIVEPKKRVTQNETDPSTNPTTLFPLIKALLQPTEDDPFRENDLFSEFVVGKTDPAVLRQREESTRVKNQIEQEANDIVDEINRVQENIKTLMQKPHLNQSEAVALADGQAFLMSLLDNFENCLARIQRVLDGGQAENADVDVDEGEGEGEGENEGEDGDDNWLDVDDGRETLEKPRAKCAIADNEPHATNGVKWYEGVDLAYLLSPNTSFGDKRSLSSDILNIFEEFSSTKTARDASKRDELFTRLKNKFSVLLPPLKMKRGDNNLMRLEKKFAEDRQEMIDSTKGLKLFQCWDRLELQYNMIGALIISLKDAIKSTPPFYYADPNVKSRFADDRSGLVQALDDVRRRTEDAFLRVGLDDYWKTLPECVRPGAVRPCFEIVIRQCDAADAGHDVVTASWRGGDASVAGDPTAGRSKAGRNRSKDSEIEVRNVNYNYAARER